MRRSSFLIDEGERLKYRQSLLGATRGGSHVIISTFEELGKAGGGHPFVLYHGAVNTEEDGPVEVCVPQRDGDKRLPSGEVAFTEIAGQQCSFPEILGAYEAVYRWAKEHGREPGGAHPLAARAVGLGRIWPANRERLLLATQTPALNLTSLEDRRAGRAGERDQERQNQRRGSWCLRVPEWIFVDSSGGNS